MLPSEQGSTKLLRISEILYISLTTLSFYLLVASRTQEAHTVWEVLHPAFIPVLFVTTLFLLAILLSSEKTTNKMLFIIVLSVLLHSFFSIVFPAGDNSGQQIVLGRTRRVFDNTILHGLSGWPTQTLQIFLAEMFDGINFQAALTVIFARMLSLDIFHVHLLFVPVLWGVFIPIASFMTTRALGGDEKTSLVSALLVSAFPYTIYFGAISVPNSVGFIFFFFSLYFMLRHLASTDAKILYWMVTFSFFSFFSHFLTGIMSLSLLILTVSFKAYENEKKSPSVTPRVLLLVSFFVCVSLLPLSFIYLRLFGTTRAAFTLDQISQLSLQEIVGSFFFGELIYASNLKTILLFVIGPAFGFLWMVYLLYKMRTKSAVQFRTPVLFLFAAFMIVLVDYGILKLLMEGLPLNEERLWVFRDFIAAPFVTLAFFAAVSSMKAFLKARSPPIISIVGIRRAIRSLGAPSKDVVLRVVNLLVTGLLLASTILFPILLAGWTTASLSVAYPQVAPLQTTLYELEAVKFIEGNTTENYVVICDEWTVFAGEMIVGVRTPGAYYFGEYDKRRVELFRNMKEDPSPVWMLLAMNQTNTDTTVAYFIVAEPRVGTEEFNNIVTRILQDNQLTLVRAFGEGKLYVFSYRKA